MMLAPLVPENAGPGFVARVAEAEGALYNYVSAPRFQPWPADGYDCEGFARRALQRTCVLGHSAPDLRARDFANVCDAVPLGQQTYGDCGFYGSGSVGHVVLVIGKPVASAGGHSPIMGANGGDSQTFMDNPEACVKRAAAGYWTSGFITYGRPRETYMTQTDFDIIRRLEECRFGRGGTLGESKLDELVRKLYGPLLESWGVL